MTYKLQALDLELSVQAREAENYFGSHGVLAIANRDSQHYKSSLGTLFLGFIAEVLSHALPRLANFLRSAC